MLRLYASVATALIIALSGNANAAAWLESAHSINTDDYVNLGWDSAFWTGNKFEAFGSNSNSSVCLKAESTDGKSWNTQLVTCPAGHPNVWTGNEYITSSNGKLYTSPDGLQLTQITLPDNLAAAQIGEYYVSAPAPTVFVKNDGGQIIGLGTCQYSMKPYPGRSVTNISTDCTLISYDNGQTWFVEKNNLPGDNRLTSGGIIDAIWDGTRYIALHGNSGGGGSTGIYTSPDGITWTLEKTFSSPTSSKTYSLNSIGFDGQNYVVAETDSIQSKIYSSADLLNWTQVFVPAKQIGGLAREGGKFIAYGQGYIAMSDNGTVWEEYSGSDLISLSRIKSDGTNIIAFGKKFIGGVYGADWGSIGAAKARTFYYDPAATPGSADSGAINGTNTAGSGSDASGMGGCFIATAAYGSYLDPNVKVLRDFRDNYLLTNSAGKAFVGFYYKHSPPVADFIREHETLRIAARTALTPVVYAVKYPGIAAGAVLFGFIGVAARRRRSKKTDK